MLTVTDAFAIRREPAIRRALLLRARAHSGNRPLRSNSPARGGFTLVELMVVLAVMGVLVSLLLVGVQSSREAARRIQCANKIRNQVVALHEFHAAMQRFPAGQQITPVGEYSWCLETLPYLEQAALLARFDHSRPWSDTRGNWSLAQTNLSIFRCPSALKKYDGKTDYAGIMGSALTSEVYQAQNGVMVQVGVVRPTSLKIAEITDGTSQTVALAECPDRSQIYEGLWISGFSSFSQDNGGVNSTGYGSVTSDISSRHPGGAYVAFADGNVRFISQSVAGYVVGALCTRNGGETVNDF